ncbi:hypothetical protein ACWD0Z_04600 [Streptomyces sp. NPDC003007]
MTRDERAAVAGRSSGVRADHVSASRAAVGERRAIRLRAPDAGPVVRGS